MRKILLFVLIMGVLGAGVLAYQYLKPTEAASAPIQAVPLSTRVQPQPISPTITPPYDEDLPNPTDSMSINASTSTGAMDESADEQTSIIFEIDPAQSKARFIIDEVLNKSPKTVVGETDQISGQLLIDVSSPQNSKVGVIQVNTRTLTTDNEFRNRAVKNRILLTDQYEFVTFTPAEINGLPEQVSIDQQLSFQITGDLTILDVTRRVTFEVEVTPISEDLIQGHASTTILYADYGIEIPEVPSVTGVSDEVKLEIAFSASPVK